MRETRGVLVILTHPSSGGGGFSEASDVLTIPAATGLLLPWPSRTPRRSSHWLHLFLWTSPHVCLLVLPDRRPAFMVPWFALLSSAGSSKAKKIFSPSFHFLIYLFSAVLGLRCYVQLFSRRGEQGLLSSHGVRASHCNGFSCCGAPALECKGSVVACGL